MTDQFSSEVPDLLQSHLEHLLASAISIDVIRERGYKSILGPKPLEDAGFAKSQRRSPCILIPLIAPDGSSAGYQIRPDKPREDKNGKKIKYETPLGRDIRISTHQRCIPKIADPTSDLWITEGIKKVDSLVSAGVCAIGLNGVYGFKGKNQFGGVTTQADLDYIGLKGRLVYIVYDSDITTKLPVKKACERLVEHLKRKGAQCSIIQLPQSADGKTGVDDYLAQGHRLEDLKALVVSSPDQIDEEAIAFHSPLYTIHEGQFCVIKSIDGMKVKSPLCNFTARIIDEILEDDGLQENRVFTVDGMLCNGRQLPEIKVPAAEFSNLNWVTGKWGARALVSPGSSTKDHLRYMIQRSQVEHEPRRVFRHTGWIKSAGQPVFLTASGGLDRSDIEVSLDGRMAQYSLPEDPDAVDPVEATAASVSFLDLGNPDVMIPLWASMYLSPLSEILEPDFMLWVTGRTGSFKSTMVGLVLCHFGSFTYKTLPAEWPWWTAMRLSELAFIAKDIPLVIDNWIPGSSREEQKDMDKKANRIIQAIGDRQGRGRYAGGKVSQDTPPPKGFIISTGEQLPDVESTQGRLFIIRPEPDEIDLAALTYAQNEHAPLYQYAMAHFIRWCSAHYQDLQERLPRQFSEARQRAFSEDMHKRLPAAVGYLFVGLDMGLSFARDVGAITEEQYQKRRDTGWKVLVDLAIRQADTMKEQRQSQRFLSALKTLLDHEKMLVIDKKYSHFSEIPVYHGLEPKPLELKSGQAWVGWVDDQCYYLLPEITYTVVSEYCLRANGHPLGKKHSVMDDLRRAKATVCRRDPGRQGGYKNDNLVRVGPNGSVRATVIQLKKSAFDDLSPESLEEG